MKILAWALALFLCACAAVRMEKPMVSLAGLDVESIGLFEQNFILRLRVKNPNDVDIPVEGLTFEVELNGKPFANGVSDSTVTIPRLGEAVLDVRATSTLAALLQQWNGLDASDTPGLDYRVKGNLRVSGHGALPFEHQGLVAFPGAQPGDGGKRKPRPGAV